LKKNYFLGTIISNNPMRFCWAAMAFSFAAWGASASEPESVVRADTRSGRLIRTFVVPRAARISKPATPELQRMIETMARQHEVDPLLVHSVIQVESNYNAQAVSPKGAMGLMQLIPSTARRFGVKDAFDAQDNLEGGIKYLKHLQQLYGDDSLALAAYNAGEGAVAKYRSVPPYAETQNYVTEVGRRYSNAVRRQAKEKPVAEAEKVAPRIQEFVDADGRIHYQMP